MTLRTRLLLAQSPMAAALALVGILAVVTLAQLGRYGQEILKDNYRSVLAAQRMKEYLERIDSAALFLVVGDQSKGIAQIQKYRPRFEDELRTQEGNITEQGEDRATEALRERWGGYQETLVRFLALSGTDALKSQYLTELEPAFLAAKGAADAILALNQDAMVHKSEDLKRHSDRVNTLMVVGVLMALLAGLAASGNLTSRVLRPVQVLGQAVRRLGEGDLEARARVEGALELKQLSSDFNGMAARLKAYRESSLGELLQAQQASQAAIDSLPDPVIVFGVHDELLNVNSSAEALLGLSIEMVGAPLARVPPALRELLERVRTHVLSGKGPYLPRGYEEALRLDAADGPRFLLPRASPVYAEASGIVGATVILQDVTRLRRFDELKNDLVATVAHEFRTPLTSLRMAIHLCAEEVVGPITEKQAELLFAAREDCERLQGIVDDLLNLARLQSGHLELELQEVDANRLIEGALSSHRLAAGQRDLKLRAQVEPGAEKLKLDKDRIGLVLANLISNAMRHSPVGGTISVRVTQSAGQNRFEIRDSGVGIPLDQQKRIFDKFYRVPGIEGGGAGLGLSIAREVVEAHRGAIGVESAPGQGSCFWFTLPRQV